MLATDPALLKDEYDVVIVGSGYGGATTAARLGYANAKAGGRLRIAILERGIEHPTGSYPVTAGEFAGLLKTPVSPLGLFEFVISSTFAVVQGSGLGGTSLCNGNVCIIPDREVFEKYWPRAISEEDPPLGKYYQRALAMLDAVPYADGEDLAKARVLEEMSRAVGGAFSHLNLAVTKTARVTRYGIPRLPCVNCTSCISGCNYEAKNTLDKNYLPMARHFGVEMFTRMEIDSIVKLGGGGAGKGYQLAVKQRLGKSGTDVQWRTVNARRLVLAAGCLGTNGILLRSQTPSLRFSRQLGQHFSGNGDFFALAYNLDQVANFNGWGIGVPEEFHVKGGPTITSVFHLNQDKPLNQRLTIEEASMPAPFVETFRNLAFAAAPGQPWLFLNTPAKFRRWLSDRYRNNTGAINSSLLFLGMGFDSSNGVVKLKSDGEVTIDWPGASDDEVFKLLTPPTIQASEALGGNQLPNPLLTFDLPFTTRPMTGHPIGGCATAEDVDHGVVDAAGRVFDADGGLHDGLYIFDGSVFPFAIGVNVLLTVTAFAERASELLRRELGLPGFDPAGEGSDKL
jgi:cholesterol oxidase